MNQRTVMEQRSRELAKEIWRIDQKLSHLPLGTLEVRRNKGGVKWFVNRNGKSQYLSRKEKPLAQRLAERTYYIRTRSMYQAEKDAVDAYLKKVKHFPVKTAEQLVQNQEFRQLLEPVLDPVQKELLEWERADYERNPYHKDNLKITTAYGDKVRSKSEALILTALRDNHIPVRYDGALVVNGKKIYPDFLIRHPKTGEYFIWEHLGLLDEEGYAKNAAGKLLGYSADGWIVSQNLILTGEREGQPLDMAVVMMLISHYFLS